MHGMTEKEIEEHETICFVVTGQRRCILVPVNSIGEDEQEVIDKINQYLEKYPKWKVEEVKK